MDYNIHIHLPDGQTAGGSSEQAQESTQSGPRAWYDQLVKRIQQCYNWRSIYELSEDLHRIGLTIRDTNGGRMILCRMEEGRPIADKIVDDYIFVGAKDCLDEEISSRAMEVITDFIHSNASYPQTLIRDGQDYTKDMALYGKPLEFGKRRQQRPLSDSKRTMPVEVSDEDRGQQEVVLISKLMDQDVFNDWYGQ